MPGVRVRFAPSPTGYLHVGGARTALFNWFFARHEKGTFILRIEDTDVARSSEDMVSGILEGLTWLGIDWDEGPFYQSQRLTLYRDFANGLLSKRQAYRCFCNPDALKAKREQAEREKKSPQYDRTCRVLPDDVSAARAAAGEPFAIRFEVSPGKTRLEDRVRGNVEFDHENIEDFVLLRSDGHPTYHLSVVVDDIDMRITHVIRGEDHLSNTPKQVLLYGAAGATPPVFAHLPLILGPDKKRLSKRHGATSVTEYRDQGYLPQAMVNFLALLGWSPGSAEEVFSREELVHRFSLDRVGSGSPIFNTTKLDWFNGRYINLLPDDVLIPDVERTLEQAGLWKPEYRAEKREWFLKVVSLLRPRAHKIADFARTGAPFFSDDVVIDRAAAEKHLTNRSLPVHLEKLVARWTAIPEGEFTHERLDQGLREMTAELGVKASELIHPVRLAVTGVTAGPSLFELLELIGKDRVLTRLNALRQSLLVSGPGVAVTDP